jgi:hypothetical protein
MKRWLALSFLLAATVACRDGGITGPTIPDITGEWVGSWTLVAQGSGIPSQVTVNCSGSLQITTQRGRVFSGTALLGGESCSFPPLPFDGEAEVDGSFIFTLNLLASCTLTAGSADFLGSVEGDSLVATNSLSAECESGNLSLTTSFSGDRVP